jgi:hypothetical protein
MSLGERRPNLNVAASRTPPHIQRRGDRKIQLALLGNDPVNDSSLT